ncbi:MAG: ABC transporter ATP-binding protein [Bacteroidota bacterium]
MLAILKNISKIYMNPGSPIQNTVLQEISLDIQPGEKIAIIGPSGSGKTTLLNILGTLDKPTSGDVSFEGIGSLKLDSDRLAAIRNTFLGFVFQSHHLLPQLSLIENIMLPLMPLKDRDLLNAAKSRALVLIERVGLTQHINKFPAQLSLGECQRTAVIRALINNPKLLLADEPTGSLDAFNATELTKLLCELNMEQNVALVIVTHSMELAEKMDKIYQLRQGRLHEFEKN